LLASRGSAVVDESAAHHFFGSSSESVWRGQRHRERWLRTCHSVRVDVVASFSVEVDDLTRDVGVFVGDVDGADAVVPVCDDERTAPTNITPDEQHRRQLDVAADLAQVVGDVNVVFSEYGQAACAEEIFCLRSDHRALAEAGDELGGVGCWHGELQVVLRGRIVVIVGLGFPANVAHWPTIVV